MQFSPQDVLSSIHILSGERAQPADGPYGPTHSVSQRLSKSCFVRKPFLALLGRFSTPRYTHDRLCTPSAADGACVLIIRAHVPTFPFLPSLLAFQMSAHSKITDQAAYRADSRLHSCPAGSEKGSAVRGGTEDGKNAPEAAKEQPNRHGYPGATPHRHPSDPVMEDQCGHERHRKLVTSLGLLTLSQG